MMDMDEQGQQSAPAVTTADLRLKLKRREAWVDLPGEYEYFRFRMWVNPPSSVSLRLRLPRAVSAYTTVFLEHNGWCDDEGNTLPQLTDPKFWLMAPDELIRLMIALAEQEMQKLPNSIARPRPR